jgi:hypothetical protein
MCTLVLHACMTRDVQWQLNELKVQWSIMLYLRLHTQTHTLTVIHTLLYTFAHSDMLQKRVLGLVTCSFYALFTAIYTESL